MDRGVWQATFRRVAKSQTRLSMSMAWHVGEPVQIAESNIYLKSILNSWHVLI